MRAKEFTARGNIGEKIFLEGPRSRGISIGSAIRIPKEQQSIPFMNKWFGCNYFFVRMVLLFKYFIKRGISSIDEFFEALKLTQTQKIIDFQIVIFRKSYWEPLMPVFHQKLETRMIENDDLKYVLFTDAGDEAMEQIKRVTIEKYYLYRNEQFHRVKGVGIQNLNFNRASFVG